MNYIDEFLKTDEPHCRLSLNEKTALSYAFLQQAADEIFNPDYEPRFTAAYFSEEKTLAWMDKLSQLPGYQFLKLYYRPKLHDADKIPEQEGAMLVSNHTTIYFGDVTPLFLGVYENKRRILYGLAHHVFKRSDIMKTIMCIPGNRSNALQLLKEDKLVLVCPEGILGACKPWKQNNKVLPVEGFSKTGMGYLRVAYESGKPIIPVANVGAEETALILGDVKPLVDQTIKSIDDLFAIGKQKWGEGLLEFMAKVKVVPLLVNLFPLPSKVDAYVGDAIPVRELLGNNPQLEDYWELNKLVIESLQQQIDQHLRKKKTLLQKLSTANSGWGR
ncbi:MAG: 1-acyl-sn-glycerol-3-phosphate acyltransferase [Nanoarchaeota archaeon]